MRVTFFFFKETIRTATHEQHLSTTAAWLHLAFELGCSQWKLTFTIAHGQPARLRTGQRYNVVASHREHDSPPGKRSREFESDVERWSLREEAARRKKTQKGRSIHAGISRRRATTRGLIAVPWTAPASRCCREGQATRQCGQVRQVRLSYAVRAVSDGRTRHPCGATAPGASGLASNNRPAGALQAHVFAFRRQRAGTFRSQSPREKLATVHCLG